MAGGEHSAQLEVEMLGVAVVTTLVDLIGGGDGGREELTVVVTTCERAWSVLISILESDLLDKSILTGLTSVFGDSWILDQLDDVRGEEVWLTENAGDPLPLATVGVTT